MYKRCDCCNRFYNKEKNDKMCSECKRQFEVTLEKLKNNKALQEVMQRLADR